VLKPATTFEQSERAAQLIRCRTFVLGGFSGYGYPDLAALDPFAVASRVIRFQPDWSGEL
jgi:hypothetical protein